MDIENIRSTASILEPGLWQLDVELERYNVPACGVIVVDLYPDDILVVRDPEGGQLEVTAPIPDDFLDAAKIFGLEAAAAAYTKSDLS